MSPVEGLLGLWLSCPLLRAGIEWEAGDLAESWAVTHWGGNSTGGW